MDNFEGILPITTLPGVKRDGTAFDNDYFADALWCRWQRGKPRKIGGYRNLTGDFSGPVRGCHIDSANGQNFIYGGSASVLEMTVIDNTGADGSITDRTPVGFQESNNNLWQFASLFDAGGTAQRVIAHAGQNLADIDSTVQTPIYFGDATGYGQLITTGTSVSGGVFSLYPYLMGLDNDGYAIWTGPNLPMSFGSVPDGGGGARIAAKKLIKGMRIRGGSGYAPAGLIWSLDEIYRCYFVGGAPVFAFDYLADTALLSTSATIEYNGKIYWPDVNCFKVYNGAVEDLPNDMNLNYFYDNLNQSQRQKVWGIKHPRFNELWWFWPKGNATECTDVIIYNIKEKTWYDTRWAQDQQARSCGIYSSLFNYPLMFGLDASSSEKYSLWQHEFGTDRIENGQSYAIRSYFETTDIAYCADIATGQWVGDDRWVELKRVEPDFIQNGEMILTIKGRKYAVAQDENSTPFRYDPDTTKIDMKEQRRQLSFRFESNVVGGTYQTGKILLHTEKGDARQ